MIAICTLLCGGETFNDMEDFGHSKRDWFETFLTLRNGVPSHDTFNRLMAALDGKALRRALNAAQSIQYVVSAWAQSNDLVLGQWMESGPQEQRDYGRARTVAMDVHCAE